MIQVLILGGNSCGDEGTKGEELKELKRETKELKRENARVKQEYIECYGRKGFPGSSDVKNLPTCRSPGLGRSPGGGHGNSLQYSCLENPHGQRSLKGYSPLGHKEADMPEQLSTAW